MRISDLIIALAEAQAEVGNVPVMHAHEVAKQFGIPINTAEIEYEEIVSVERDRLGDQNIIWFGV